MKTYTVVLRHDMKDFAIAIKSISSLEAIRAAKELRIGKPTKVYELLSLENLPTPELRDDALTVRLEETFSDMLKARDEAMVEGTQDSLKRFNELKTRYENLLNLTQR